MMQLALGTPPGVVKLTHFSQECPWSVGHSDGAALKNVVVRVPVTCYRYTACGKPSETCFVAVRLLPSRIAQANQASGSVSRRRSQRPENSIGILAATRGRGERDGGSTWDRHHPVVIERA